MCVLWVYPVMLMSDLDSWAHLHPPYSCHSNYTALTCPHRHPPRYTDTDSDHILSNITTYLKKTVLYLHVWHICSWWGWTQGCHPEIAMEYKLQISHDTINEVAQVWYPQKLCFRYNWNILCISVWIFV